MFDEPLTKFGESVERVSLICNNLLKLYVQLFHTVILSTSSSVYYFQITDFIIISITNLIDLKFSRL